VLSNRQKGIFDQYRWLISRIQWILDGVVMALLLFLLCRLCGEPFRIRYQLLGLATFLLTVVVFQAALLYQPWRGADLMRLVRRVILNWILVIAILSVLGFVTKTSVFFSRKVVLIWMALTPLVLVALRLEVYLGLRWLRQQGRNTRSVVIAGAGELGQRLARNMVDSPWLGMRLFGFFDDSLAGEVKLPGGGKPQKNYPILGSLDQMIPYVQANQVHMVYLTLPLRAEDRLAGGGGPAGYHRLGLFRTGCLHPLPVVGRIHRSKGHTPHLPVGNPVFRDQRLGETAGGPVPGQPAPAPARSPNAVNRSGSEVVFAGADNL